MDSEIADFKPILVFDLKKKKKCNIYFEVPQQSLPSIIGSPNAGHFPNAHSLPPPYRLIKNHCLIKIQERRWGRGEWKTFSYLKWPDLGESSESKREGVGGCHLRPTRKVTNPVSGLRYVFADVNRSASTDKVVLPLQGFYEIAYLSRFVYAIWIVFSFSSSRQIEHSRFTSWQLNDDDILKWLKSTNKILKQ